MTISLSKAVARLSTVKRITILGDGAIGKTTLMKALKQGHRKTIEQERTAFIEFDSFNLETNKILYMDLAGQASAAHPLKLLTDQVLRNSHLILLTFSTSRFESLKNLQNWFLAVKNYYQITNRVIPPIFMVGTKADLPIKVDLDFVNLTVRNVPEIIDFCLVSAHTGSGIEDFKNKISKILVKNGSSNLF